jgi:hypothetical protein
MKFDNFSIIANLDDFIYKRKPVPLQMSFSHLSKMAHTSHNSVNHRYQKFMRFKRSDDGSINKARAKRCCNMVKKHIHDLIWIRAYLKNHDLHMEHPVFTNKINKWIDECERIHSRYKHHINDL